MQHIGNEDLVDFGLGKSEILGDHLIQERIFFVHCLYIFDELQAYETYSGQAENPALLSLHQLPKIRAHLLRKQTILITDIVPTPKSFRLYQIIMGKPGYPCNSWRKPASCKMVGLGYLMFWVLSSILWQLWMSFSRYRLYLGVFSRVLSFSKWSRISYYSWRDYIHIKG